MSLPVDKGGCGWYRIRQPLNMINEFTKSEGHVIDKDVDDMIMVADGLSKSDILLVRQGGEIGLGKLKEDIQEFGKQINQDRTLHAKIVYDIDDNIEMISPYSEHYKGYGLKEFSHNGLKVWENEKSVFNLEANKKRVASLMKGLTEADLVTVTTEKLREYALEYNPNVAIAPNVIDLKKWWVLPTVKSKQLRVGWSGGMSHYEDWYSIKEPLNRALRKYRFTLVLVGSGFTGLIDEDLRDLVEIHPWVPFEAHSYHMMCMNLDLAIIPLADIPFNNYKSPIKYLEFSAMGVPCLVADVTPYKEVIHSMKKPRALGYRNEEEFAFKLEELLERPRLRREIGEIARLYVEENWSAEVWAQKFVDIYSAIL